MNKLTKQQAQSSNGFLESSGLKECLVRVQKRKRAYGGRAANAATLQRLVASQGRKRGG